MLSKDFLAKVLEAVRVANHAAVRGDVERFNIETKDGFLETTNQLYIDLAFLQFNLYNKHAFEGVCFNFHYETDDVLDVPRCDLVILWDKCLVGKTDIEKFEDEATALTAEMNKFCFDKTREEIYKFFFDYKLELLGIKEPDDCRRRLNLFLEGKPDEN